MEDERLPACLSTGHYSFRNHYLFGLDANGVTFAKRKETRASFIILSSFYWAGTWSDSVPKRLDDYFWFIDIFIFSHI